MVTYNKPFKVWAFSVWHLLILIPLSFIMTLFVWVMMKARFPNPMESGGAAAILGILLFGSLFSLSLISVLFTRIKVNDDGVIIQLPSAFGGGIYYSFNELQRAKWRIGGRAVNFSGTRTDYWIVPFSYKKLAYTVKSKTTGVLEAVPPTTPRMLDYAIFVAPIIILALLGRILRLYGFYIDPLIHATAWGSTTFLSTCYFVYKAWKRFRINNFERLGSALAYGLIMGVPIFLFTYLLFTLF